MCGFKVIDQLSFIFGSAAGPAAGHYRRQHLGKGPYRRPPGSWIFADRGHAMAGHRVGLLGLCQFLPCLESRLTVNEEVAYE